MGLKSDLWLNPIARYALLLAAGLGITIATGVVCGRISQRWGPVPDMLAAADHLRTFPVNIGSWQLSEEVTMPELIVDTLHCAGYVSRKYVDRRTGDEISLAIIVGPSGPVSVHTPEICYSSQAYTIEEPRKAKELVDVAGNRHAFWFTTFSSNVAIAEELRVYYGWSADRTWNASESPRFEFAGKPMLFKLQIAAEVPPLHADAGKDPCQDFLEQLLQSGWTLKG